jgi:hypothetical protein
MVDEYKIGITAGPGREFDVNETYGFVLPSKSSPGFTNKINEEPYKTLSKNTLLAAREIVKKTGKKMMLNLEVKFN